MEHYLIAISVIILICVFLNRVSSRFGIPVLLLFLMVGVLFGALDPAAENMRNGLLIQKVCTTALIFIMFYGGFGTSWKTARPVIVPSGLLATLGVFLTAGLTGLFCHYALRWDWTESFLLGSVVSSTDAASVFSILRGRKLGLKNGTAPILEVESGSNDPCSYMLTAVMLSVVAGKTSAGAVVWTIISQLAFGTIGGILIAWVATFILRRWPVKSSGFGSMYIFAVALIAYALPSAVGGNGYLSAYIVGIVLGNVELEGKKQLVSFFDGVTSLMQILIFFLLGLLARPQALPAAVLPAVGVFFCLLLFARPAAVLSVLLPFRRFPLRQIALISFVGLRGAASIVFAIMTLGVSGSISNDIFSVVFCIVLISLLLQGTLIPYVAGKLEMTDSSDVMQTFNDFSDSVDASFGSVRVRKSDRWEGKALKDLEFPGDVIVALVVRGKERLVPNGDTVLQEGDEVVLCISGCDESLSANIYEKTITSHSSSCGHSLSERHDSHSLILLIKRAGQTFIPNGATVLQAGDRLVVLRKD